jgi:hypothetical protein
MYHPSREVHPHVKYREVHNAILRVVIYTRYEEYCIALMHALRNRLNSPGTRKCFISRCGEMSRYDKRRVSQKLTFVFYAIPGDDFNDAKNKCLNSVEIRQREPTCYLHSARRCYNVNSEIHVATRGKGISIFLTCVIASSQRSTTSR